MEVNTRRPAASQPPPAWRDQRSAAIENRSPGPFYLWSKRVALLSIPVFVLLILVLGAQTRQDSVFDSPWLLLLLNVFFL